VNANQSTTKSSKFAFSPLAELPAGRIVDGSYRVAATLARTDYADLYAVVAADGKRLALELLAAPGVPGKAYKDRFAQSALSSSRLTSPFVASARAAGIDPTTGSPWIVYDAFDETLASAIAGRGPASPEKAVRLLRPIAEALEVAHATGTAHGALRPEAVVLTGGAVRVLNFGIAKVLSDARAATSPSASPSDPRWAAPEQCSLTGSADRLSDVWSLGQLAFWMVTGRSHEDAADHGPGGHRVTPAFDAWLARCLEDDRAVRWPTALIAVSELARALDAERTGSMDRTISSVGPVAMPASTRPVQSAHKSNALLVGGILGAVALLGVGVAGVLGVRAVRSAKASAAASVATSEQASTDQTAPAEAHVDTTRRGPWLVPVGTSPVRGPAAAPVTIVELGDFQSRACASAEPTVQRLRASYGPKVRLVWKNARAGTAAELALEARAKKGDATFWLTHDAVFATADAHLGEQDLLRIAGDVGLDAKSTAAALGAHTHQKALEADAQLARDLDALEAPVFFVNGTRVDDASFESLTRTIDDEMAKADRMIASGVPVAAVYDTIQGQASPAVDLAALPRSNAATTNNSAGSVTTTSATVPVTAGTGKLVVVDLAPGRGPAATTGDKLTVRYVGKRLDDGVTYDTVHKTSPFTFTLGKGAVTKGWEQGLIGMKSGGRRRLVVPPSLAYGERGLSPSVPPNATLVFEIELVSVE
jgi:FKBP-type peptidyl-prolyl cis-trans isomerase/protein-disulfide isomerase